MANTVVLGAGVMGSALANVAAVNNKVTLVGSPLDNDIIERLNKDQHHTGLQITLSEKIVAIKSSDMNAELMANAEVIVMGVSSPGVTWALDFIQRYSASPDILALVTKGANYQCRPYTTKRSHCWHWRSLHCARTCNGLPNTSLFCSAR